MDKKRKKIEKKQQKINVLIIIGITFFIISIFSTIFALININNSNIISGVKIENIDMSGLTAEEARSKLELIYKEKQEKDIMLKYEEYETNINSELLDINYNIEEAVREAISFGKEKNIFANNYDILFALFGFKNIKVNMEINEEETKKTIEDIGTKLPGAVIEPEYIIENDNLIITKGKEGKQINIDEMVGLIQNEIYNLNFNNNTPLEIQTITTYPSEVNLEAIHQEIYKEAKDAYYTQNPYKVHPSENGLDFKVSMEEAQNLLANAQDTCTIPLKVTYPKISTNMIGSEAFPNLLSTFSTNYNANQTNRTTNLRLAANKINGTVLMPGQTFSYNKVVGNRTTAAGYKEAGTYVNGQIVDGVGGGICQITTTLYNAVLYANLDIVQRTNHQFIPSYSTASRDATVVYGAIDFQFKNNREYPIKIYCSVSGGVAKCNIFGVKTANDYEVQLTSRITSTTSNAIYSEAYKILKKNGTVVSTTLLSKDKYLRH